MWGLLKAAFPVTPWRCDIPSVHSVYPENLQLIKFLWFLVYVMLSYLFVHVIFLNVHVYVISLNLKIISFTK